MSLEREYQTHDIDQRENDGTEIHKGSVMESYLVSSIEQGACVCVCEGKQTNTYKPCFLHENVIIFEVAFKHRALVAVHSVRATLIIHTVITIQLVVSIN